MDKRRAALADYFIILVVAFCLGILGLDRLANIPPVRLIANQLYTWTLLLAAFGLLAGIFNLLWIHGQRIGRGQADWPMSLVLIAVALAVFSVGMVESSGAFGPLMQWVFTNVLTPVQSALFALLAFFLAAAAYRYLRIGRHGSSWMLFGALLMMLAQMPLMGGLLPVDAYSAIHWLIDQPVMAALRGALLGSSLATLLVGLHLVVKG
ncbi:MAG: hypothetical protein R3A44_22685 [Caldilineaceae bacterium]